MKELTTAIYGSGKERRLLKGALVAADEGTRACDILIAAGGHIEAVEPDIAGSVDARVVDIAGSLVVPGFVDAHQHLDKTGVVSPNPSGTLQGAREAFARFARTASREDIADRARRTILQCRGHGTTAIRSHVNVDKDAGFTGLEVLRDVRAELGDTMTLQFVAFMTPHPNQDLDWLEANIADAAGLADAIGGTPAVAEDPGRYLDILFETAARHDIPVDLHMDEHLDAERLLFDAVIDRTERYGMQGRVILGHASVLSAVPRSSFERICNRLLRNRIGVITLPAANLYLQGRDRDVLPPRGLTRVRDLLQAGVPVAAACDNIQDPFIPTGSGDLLEIARWTFLASYLGADDIGAAFAMITDAPAMLTGLADTYGLRKGARADMVICDCANTTDLVARGTGHRSVLINGLLVS